MKHPGYAIAGSLAGPLALGTLFSATLQNRPRSYEELRGRMWKGVGVAAVASYGTFLYANQAEISEETKSFLESAAVGVGAIGLILAVPLLLSAGRQ